ncbi:hypothetical protein D3C78_1071490 [compost metagenome]
MLELSLRLKSVFNVALILAFGFFSFSVVWFIWMAAVLAWLGFMCAWRFRFLPFNAYSNIPVRAIPEVIFPNICPLGSCLFMGSPAQYAYAFNPPSPNGLQLSELLNRINTGLKARYPFPNK